MIVLTNSDLTVGAGHPCAMCSARRPARYSSIVLAPTRRALSSQCMKISIALSLIGHALEMPFSLQQALNIFTAVA